MVPQHSDREQIQADHANICKTAAEIEPTHTLMLRGSASLAFPRYATNSIIQESRSKQKVFRYIIYAQYMLTVNITSQ